MKNEWSKYIEEGYKEFKLNYYMNEQDLYAKEKENYTHKRDITYKK